MIENLEQVLETNKRLVAQHLEAENQHLLTETIETLHSDCVFEDVPLNKIYHGKEGAAEYYQTWWNAFEITVVGNRPRQWTMEGNLIAEPRFVGKHVGDFFGLKATGRPIDFPFVVVIQFRDGLMLGERFYYDLTNLLRQLGTSSLPDITFK